MKLDPKFSKCIYCLENPADSWEHIIPYSIGGRFQVKMLCSNCNNNLGSRLVSKIKEDPSIRLAIRNLKNEILELYETMENGQIYNATNTNKDHIKLKYKNGKFETRVQKKEDNSLIFDTKKALKNIRQMLKKDGLLENEIEDKIKFFQKIKDNEFLQLSKNTKIVKWSIKSMYPNMEGPFINEQAIVLMAYEFLSVCLAHNLIYENKFNFIREFIKEGKKSKKLVVERLTSRHYDPYHKIYPEFLETEIVINIMLFEWLVYKVYFKGFKSIGKDFVYLEDLKNKKSFIAESVSEAKQNIYYEC